MFTVNIILRKKVICGELSKVQCLFTGWFTESDAKKIKTTKNRHTTDSQVPIL